MKSFPVTRKPAGKLLVFARVPEPGLVKTRLAATLGDERALEIYRAMIDDVLRSVTPLSASCEIEVLWTGSEDVDGAALRAAFPGVDLAMQAGKDLSERLDVAFSERIVFHQADKVIAIGIDEPAVSASCLEHAFRLLDSCEYVIGPASDGGYWLIGCRGDAFRSEIFHDIPWGTSGVLAATRDKIRSIGATLATLGMRGDIDVEDDLRAFAAIADDASAVGAVLRNWGWR